MKRMLINGTQTEERRLAIVDGQKKMSEGGRFIAFLAFELFEAVAAFLADQHGLTDFPGAVAVGYCQGRQCQIGFGRTAILESFHGGAYGVAVIFLAEFFLSAEADQQNPFARTVRNMMQHQAGAAATLEVAVLDQRSQGVPTRTVEHRCRCRQLAVFKDADNGAGGALFVRMGAFYAKFHRLVPLVGRVSG